MLSLLSLIKNCKKIPIFIYKCFISLLSYLIFKSKKLISHLCILNIIAPEPAVEKKVEVKKSVYVPPAQRNNFQGKQYNFCFLGN